MEKHVFNDNNGKIVPQEADNKDLILLKGKLFS